MSGRETFYGGHPAQRDSDQLVGDPQCGGEVNVQLHSLAHHRGDVVLTNTEVGSRLEPESLGFNVYFNRFNAGHNNMVCFK